MKQLFILLSGLFLYACSKHTADVPSGTPPQPDRTVVISGTQTLVLMLDGDTSSSKDWGFTSLARFSPSGLTKAEEAFVADSVQYELQHLVGGDIKVVTDPAAAAAKSERIIVTTSTAWYGGNASGVAYVNSWYWQNGTPAFVFSSSLTYTVDGVNRKYNLGAIVAAILHEFGHTLGLYHTNSDLDWMYANALKTTGWFGEPTTDVNEKKVYEKSTIAYGILHGSLPSENPYYASSNGGAYGRSAIVKIRME